ncbi:MAG: hypothetical protein R3C16_01745 [Hyphomonadaceae bacterium]
MRYGTTGAFGVATPQSNPTVEPEFGVLMPRTARVHTTRLISDAADPLERLRIYLRELERTLRSYDGMKFSAFGFACTGSSYLLGHEAEAAIVTKCAETFGYPVVTAADAIVWMLGKLNAKKVVVLAPYPEALIEAGKGYFRDRGVDVIRHARVVTRTSDTRTIYELGVDQAREALAALDTSGADAILVSGTGMPSLLLVDPNAALPVVSSNCCLGARMLDVAGGGALDGLEPRDWRVRLKEALGA